MVKCRVLRFGIFITFPVRGFLVDRGFLFLTEKLPNPRSSIRRSSTNASAIVSSIISTARLTSCFCMESSLLTLSTKSFFNIPNSYPSKYSQEVLFELSPIKKGCRTGVPAQQPFDYIKDLQTGLFSLVIGGFSTFCGGL